MMRKTTWILVSVFTLFTSTDVLGQMLYSNDNVEVHKLQDKLFLLKETTRFTVNILAIEGEEGILLMDTGFGDVSDDLSDAVNYLGKDVRMIINSHNHGDHAGGNSAFGSGLTIIGHAACKEEFQSEGNNIIAIDAEYSLKFSGMEISCLPFPGGHSQCDIIVHVPELNMAFLGDLYLSESFPLVIIGVGSKAQTVVQNLKEISALLPKDTRLFSGHGKETSMKDLEAYIKMLETTIGLVRAEMNQGKSLDELKDSDLLLDYQQWGKFFAFITRESWITQIYQSYE